MLTEQKTDRVNWHLTLPVCRTWRGVKTHLSLVSINDLRLLCGFFSCAADTLVEKFWAKVYPYWRKIELEKPVFKNTLFERNQVMEAREHFARITTFANIDKYERGKSGRKIVVVPSELSGRQLEAVDRLADGEKEVLLSIVPSCRGTLFAGKEFIDLTARVTKDSAEIGQDAIGILILAVSTKMRERMLEKYNEGERDWDDEGKIEVFRQLAAEKAAAGDWIDALNYIAMAWNLEKPLAGQDEESEQQEAEAPLLDEQQESEELAQEAEEASAA